VNTGDILHAQDDEKEKYEKNGGKDFLREEQEGVTLSAPLRIALATQDLVMISLLLSRGAYSADLALEHLISGHEWTTPSKPLSGLDVLMPLVVPSKDSMDPLPLELVQVVLIYKSNFHPSTLGKMLGRAILLDDAAPVFLLLKAGANLDFDGISSFTEAFSNSSAPVVNVLLEYGADPNIPELAKHLASKPEGYHLRDFTAKSQLMEKWATNDLDTVHQMFAAVLELERRRRRKRKMGPERSRTGPTVYDVHVLTGKSRNSENRIIGRGRVILLKGRPSNRGSGQVEADQAIEAQDFHQRVKNSKKRNHNPIWCTKNSFTIDARLHEGRTDTSTITTTLTDFLVVHMYINGFHYNSHLQPKDFGVREPYLINDCMLSVFCPSDKSTETIFLHMD